MDACQPLGPVSPQDRSPRRTSLAHARARADPHFCPAPPGSPALDHLNQAPPPASRAPGPIPGPSARPAETGGRGSSPHRGVMGPYRARVPGEDKGRISQGRSDCCTKVRADLPSGPVFYNGLGRPGLGNVRLSAPAETRSKPLRNGPENPDKGAGPPRSGADRFHAARCLGVPV